MADDICQFTELLQKFLQSDNDQRTQAEETYDSIHIVSKIQLLQQIVENQAAGPEVRTLSAVLLRRQFASSFEELWSQLDADSQLALKSRLLLNVQNEADGSLRNKLGECIAELARNLLDDDGNNSWPEVLKFLFDCASSGSAGLRESALHILTFVPGIFGNQQASYVNLIQQLFHHCLLDQESEKVRFEAVKAAVAFIVANDDDKTILAHFKSLLSPLLAVVEQSTVKQDDDSLLKCLIELAESVPKYLKSHLEEVVRFALKVMSNTEFDDNSRQLALEVIVSLSETAPGMMRKLESLVGVLIQQALAMMMEQEDDEEWSQADELDEEDNESNAVAAESALDRVACALGGKTILPLLLPLLVPMLRKADDWRSRYAALMAISACGEGCHKQMEQMLNDVVEAVLPFMADPHPRVRYASCNALGQMSTDFGPMFQKKFHQKVVSGLLSLLDDSANPRVQAHAGAALVNFCEDCPKTILGPYLDHIVAKLEQVLSSKFQELVQSGKKLVLEQIVTTLAAVADAAEDKFTQHYDRFMPVLKYIVENAVRPEHRLLRGKTIECISLVGLAVGAQKFMSDCHEVMQLLLKTQIDWDSISDDDPQISYMISAWARICKVMGPQFGQYLPLVMNPVLKAAAMKPEVTLMDNEEASSMGDDPDWQFVTVGDQKSFGIRTSGLEEKATACQMLVCYARELREPFAPYVEQVARIVVPHLKFYFHDGVRTAAAECLPPLLACANVQGAEYVNQLWQYICPELIKAIDLEPENAIRAEHMDAFAQCIVHMGKGCLTDEQIKELIAILDRLMVKHFERQEQRQEQRKDEDYDEVVEENLVDEDDEDVYMLSKVSDIIHAFFGTHKEGALPVFEQLLPHFVKLLQPDRPWADKQWSLCIFDDLVEHASPLSLNYQQYFLPHMVQYVCDEQPEVRQAAAYGVGVIAQYGGPGYAQVLNEAIPNLVKVITAPDSRVDLNLSPTENCISAIGKMCRYRSDVVNAHELVPHWLSWLPVWEDEEEAMHVYNFFCDLVEGNHPAVHQNLPWVMKIIAEVLRREIFEASEDTLRRLVAIARQIQSNGELFSVCLAQLDDSQKSSLMAALAA